jgi:hypothetical protein
MSIWNKVLVGLIGVASIALFYLAARTMKTHQYWRELAAKYEQRLEQLDRANETLVEGAGRPGAPGQPAIRQLRLELNTLVLDRGRQWLHCEPKVTANAGQGTAVINVTINEPDPHGIAPGAVLYGFEEADVAKGGHYLGEFRVAKADEKQKEVVLAPTARLSPREIDRLEKAAKGPWVFYETMPRDNHEIFAALTDGEKGTLLPTSSLPDYVKDGKAAAGDEPPAQVADGKYVRPLRDYQAFFTADRVERTLMYDALDAAARDEKLLKDALAQAKQQEETVKVEVAAAKEEVAKQSGQRDVVAKYHQEIERESAALRAEIARLTETNKAMAGRIAKMQLEAVRRIDERTRAMAQSGAGGL